MSEVNHEQAMNRWLIEHDISCPFCAETITILVDASAGSQNYIEDCQVCCRPIQLTIGADGDDIDSVQADCAS